MRLAVLALLRVVCLKRVLTSLLAEWIVPLRSGSAVSLRRWLAETTIAAVTLRSLAALLRNGLGTSRTRRRLLLVLC